MFSRLSSKLDQVIKLLTEIRDLLKGKRISAGPIDPEEGGLKADVVK